MPKTKQAQFNTPLEKSGLKIARFLIKNEFKVFFVGGAVRNYLLGRTFDNLDLATDAKPNEVEQILSRAGIYHKPLGKQFGTILVITKDGPIEVTTFRGESKYSDKRHPDSVEFIHDYKQDAQRRDFTINSLYLNPITEELFDPTRKGLVDLRNKIVRFVGNPKQRIEEDPLRMIRAVRLATQLSFKLESNSFAAIKTRAKYIQNVSAERVKQELDKILLSNAGPGLRLLDQTGLLRFIIPKIDSLKKSVHKSKHYHLEGSVFEHTVLAVESARVKDLNLLYALLFHDIGKAQTGMRAKKDEGWVISFRGHEEVSGDIFNKFAKKFKFSKQSAGNVEWLVRKHMYFKDYFAMKFSKQLLLAQHPAFPLLLEHWYSDEKGNKRKVHLDEYHQKYLKSKKTGDFLLHRLQAAKKVLGKLAKGDLIMKITGLKPGPALGQKINEVKEQIVLSKIKTDQDLKKYLQKNRS